MAKTRPRRSVSAKTEPLIDEVPDDQDDWLATGSGVDEAVTKARQNARPKVREFFFVKDEMNATTDSSTGKAKKKGTATALVHFAVNYADLEYKVAIPRLSIKENGKYKGYTSIGGDCAIQQATGQTASLRPVYFLIDHRSFEHEGTEYTDMIKTWIPASTMMELLDVAIDNLAEAVQLEREDLDITLYPAKITKSGFGRKTAWSVSFIPREEQCSDDAWDRSLNFFFGQDEVKANNPEEIPADVHAAKVRKLLSPDPRYMISKGGKYTVAETPKEDPKDEVPY